VREKDKTFAFGREGGENLELFGAPKGKAMLQKKRRRKGGSTVTSSSKNWLKHALGKL